MPEDEIYYLRVPQPDGLTDGVHTKDGFHLIRVLPAELSKGLQFFTARKVQDIKAKNVFRPAFGVEALVRDGLTMIRSIRTFEAQIKDHDQYLVDGYENVGRALVDRLMCHMALLYTGIQAVADGESAVADESFADFITAMSTGFYELAKELSEIKDINDTLSRTADHAASEARAAKARAEESDRKAKTAIRVAALATDDQFEEWAGAVEVVVGQGDELAKIRDNLRSRRDDLQTRLRLWQQQLDPAHEPISGLVCGLKPQIDTLEACVMHDRFDRTTIGATLEASSTTLEELAIYLSTAQEEFTKLCKGLADHCMMQEGNATELAAKLTASVRKFKAFHDRYLDRKKRWQGQGAEPYLPYDPASGYEGLISKEQYDKALAIMQDQALSAQGLLIDIQSLTHELRQLSDQGPGYPTAVTDMVSRVNDLIGQARMVIRAIGTISGEGPIPDLDDEPEIEPIKPPAEPAEPAPPPPTVTVLVTPAPAVATGETAVVLDEIGIVFYELMLIAGAIMTGNNNPLSSQSFDRLSSRAMDYVKLVKPGYAARSTSAIWQNVRAYLLNQERCHFIARIDGRMKLFADVVVTSPLSWVHCDLSKRRSECIKVTQSGVRVARTLAQKYGFDFGRALIAEEALRRTKLQARKAEEEDETDDESTAEAEAPKPADPTPAQPPKAEPVVATNQPLPVPPSPVVAPLPPPAIKPTEAPKPVEKANAPTPPVVAVAPPPQPAPLPAPIAAPPVVVAPPRKPDIVDKTPTASKAIETKTPVIPITTERLAEVRKCLGAVGFIEYRYGSKKAISVRTMMASLRLLGLCSKNETDDSNVARVVEFLCKEDRACWQFETNGAGPSLPNLRLNPQVVDVAEELHYELMLDPNTVLTALRKAAS